MKGKTYKIPTPESLKNAALHYLERYAASEASLRRVLENRLRRAALQSPAFREDEAAMQALRESIGPIVDYHKKTGALNDEAFAEMKVHSLRRQGRSARVIHEKLRIKGIKSVSIAAALEKNMEDLTPEEAELKAACAFVRRRKLGSFRKSPPPEDRYRKELAILARAGFSSALARQALKSAPEPDV